MSSKRGHRQKLPELSGIGVEIGCMDGFSTAVILEASNLHLTSIDPIVPDSMDPALIGHESHIVANVAPWNEKFRFIKDFSHNVSAIWATPIDFLFIDGDHHYDAVMRDFDQWTVFLRKGGTLAMHDSGMGRLVGASFHPGPTEVAEKRLFSRPAEWSVIGEAYSLTMAIQVI